MKKRFGFAALLLAGILLTLCGCEQTGTDETADTSLTETETAAEENTEPRVIAPVDAVSRGNAYTLTDNASYVSTKEGIASGWRLDNRGGIPRTDIEGGYGVIMDISETEGTAMIREINRVDAGLIMIETSVSLSDTVDGFYMELQNEAGKPVYTLITADGNWCIRSADGSLTPILEGVEKDRYYRFRISIDLDNDKSMTAIDETDCGVHALQTVGEDSNLLNFRFASTAEGTPDMTLRAIKITANYAVCDEFQFYADGKMPYTWTGTGAKVEQSMLRVTAGEISRSFDPVPGTVIANTSFNLTRGQAITFSLGCGEDDVVTFTSDDTHFYANGQPVYENYVKNLWYRIRLEVITAENKVRIWVNGRTVAEVDLLAETNYIDTVTVANASSSGVEFDLVDVSEKIIPEDYVPAPVHPEGEDEYTIGMNICSLWREGTHYGWGTITPYEEVEPVLGYYDEGVPETADWEIKYMVEHGIDFQAFCWYATASDAPLNNLHLEDHLHDGYMYAEYSEEMNYCLIWEASNAGKPKDLNAWKTYYVPYLMENYFKDPRYMVIDNQLVLCVFGSAKLSEYLKGEDNVKACFDYLEEVVREELGLDGVIYLACGSSSDSLAKMGFDGSYCYNWGSGGYEVSVNQNSILQSASVESMYTVPTISVGYNTLPWHGLRYPMMTVDDYRTAHEWVRDVYLPEYAEEDTWQENFLMLSTWNEYGEGTYIMPTTDERGFGYLDALREVYTTAGEADETIDMIPTAEQKERINYLYPQYRRVLRKTGYLDLAESTDMTSIHTISYTNANNGFISGVTDYTFESDGVSGITDGDAMFVTNKNLNVPAADAPYIKVTIDAKKGTRCELFFITDVDDTWAQDKSFQFIAGKDGKAEYILDMSTVDTWHDNVIGIRIDPGQVEKGTGTAELNWFKLYNVDFMSVPSRRMIVNGQEFEMQLYRHTLEDGTDLFPFDPKVALDYRLNAFHTWDWDSKQLTLDVNGHTLVYTVDADTYLLDGTEKALGYTMYMQDGLPMIDLQQLCGDVGYEYSIDEDGVASIRTAQADYFDGIGERTPGQWEFNTTGDTEGWTSTQFSMIVNNGTMLMETTTDSGDPISRQNSDVDLNAADYTTFEIRCRYKHDSTGKEALTMYFTTDSSPSMAESMTVKAYLNSSDSNDEWETYTVDLTQIESWKGLIKQLRFDPFNCTGMIEIDYMRFLP